METCDFIIDGLYLGPISSAKNEKDLRSKNITHVLSLLQKPLHKAVRNGRVYKTVPAIDTDSCNILEMFPECFAFIDEARENHTGVLVHCQAGRSRSATVVIAYLMYKFNLSFRAARNKVQCCRPEIDPNKGFEEQLLRFEYMGGCFKSSKSSSRTSQIKKQARKQKKASDFEGEVEKEKEESQLENTEEILARLSPVQNEIESVYKCRKCRATLFHKQDLTSHFAGDGEAAFDWRSKIPANQRPKISGPNCGNQCRLSVFVEPLPWMENITADCGKLHCPKCSVKIGSYVWHGEKCPCGAWVAPAFHIDNRKVDNIPTQLAQAQTYSSDCPDPFPDLTASLRGQLHFESEICDDHSGNVGESANKLDSLTVKIKES